MTAEPEVGFINIETEWRDSSPGIPTDNVRESFCSKLCARLLFMSFVGGGEITKALQNYLVCRYYQPNM